VNRSSIKVAAAKFLCNTGIDRVFRSTGAPVVLAYHRVVEDFASSSAISNPSMLVSLQMLENHLDWIGRQYRFVDLDELGARLESGDPSVGSLAALTFDDGYRDFYQLALPMLQRKGIPSAIFVVTDYVGTSHVPIHDKLYLLLKRRRRALPSFARALPPFAKVPDLSHMEPYTALRTMLELLPLNVVRSVADVLEAEDPLPQELCAPFRSLSWEELERVHRAGVTVGSHTRTHVLMPNEARSRVMDEAAGSREILQQRLGGAIRHFAYPSGVFDDVSLRAVAAAGYRFAYATTARRNLVHPLLAIPRTVLWERSCVGAQSVFSGPVLNCQIHHAFDVFAEGYRQRQTFHQENGR
jgi:peptidoglycan/xylan/chitin deacetylase (PgdA/CDA1 family)